MYTFKDLLKKFNFNRTNWIICGLAALEVLMFMLLRKSFVDYPDGQRILFGMYLIFLVADMSLMIINATRLNALMDGQFYIYQDYSPDDKKSYWVVEDEYFVLDTIPVEIKLDDYMKSKLLR